MYVIYAIYNVMINNLCDVYNFFEKKLYFNKTFYITNKIFYTKNRIYYTTNKIFYTTNRIYYTMF